jgi:2-oxoglutarate dehydrogenase E1 component
VPAHAYSGLYCTDVAKSIQVPILHVNGDEPEAVVFASRMAAEFRQRFGTDFVLDIVCYRRHGHNENDEPAFTQPIMYKAIRELPTTRALYAAKLEREGVLSAGEAQAMWDRLFVSYDQAYSAAQSYKVNKADWLEGKWRGLAQDDHNDETEEATAVSPATLHEVGLALATVPESFDANPKITRQLDAKRQMIETGGGIDWSTAEALAFGTLLLEGHHVRLSGEDCQRGTFSQRHAVLIDQTNQNEFTPLNNIRPKQAHIEIFNSLLSEAGVLGFEYGYSLADPWTLVLWEAQFGDFANGAQVIIDQFLASGETKWLRMSGLTLLLPHGFEGQGPEHSSARLERYLQLCAERNMTVANITSPANYFHALRRQLKRNFRKPLVLMTPKSLLRHKLAVSALDEFSGNSHFRTVIGETDALAPNAEIKRVVLCSGKVYYDLVEERRAQGITDVAILRLEQFYPFPERTLAFALKPYAKAPKVVWCQEELGALKHRAKRPTYVGRQAAASPATGLAKVHAAEQAALVRAALTVD